MNEKKVTIITIVCLAFILIAGGAAIWFLQFQVLEEKRQKRDEVQGQLTAAENRVKEIPKLKTDIGELEKQEKELIKKIPNLDRTEYDAFANQLDDLRRRSGVTVDRGGWVQAAKPAPVPGRPPPKPQPQSVHKVQYDLSVSGSFFQLLRYINFLEQQTRFINVENFSIAKGADAAGAAATGALKREMKLTLYSYTYRPPPEALEIEIEEQRRGRSTDIPE